MSLNIISRNTFLEIKRHMGTTNHTEIELIFNKLFNTNRSWRTIYKSTIFKEDISTIEKQQNEIKGLLNKLSNVNFDEIKKKIMIISENEELIFFTIKYIFEIALKQPLFCKHYVKLIKHIITIHKNTKDYIEETCLNFKNIVSTNNIKSNKDLSYDAFCENNILKKYKEGYSQFFGELFLNQIICTNVITENIDEMLSMLSKNLESNEDIFIEDLIICINKLLLTIINNIHEDYIKQTLTILESVYTNPLIIKRLRFKLMDLKDKLETKLK
jgi:hypothetical protein